MKSFDLQGFKSFKERTRLEFQGGITTIVGPNGSGKSNIADAFRWVLGEQRIKALRGSKGEDVIFGGTKIHKPLGVASVQLHLDNRQGILKVPYEEVVVGRKIYRSGEGEYTINGASCRLKDIHDLFHDTGMGKDSFSIIGQGEIERILNARPEERRGMIEELAGIVRYRNRKEESLRKLEHAKASLERVQDIIRELEGNVGSLEDASRKAARYLELKEEADSLELNLILTDIAEGETALSGLEQELQTAIDLVAASSADIEGREAQYEENRLQLLNLDAQMKDGRLRIMALKDQLSRHREDLLKKETFCQVREEKNQELEEEIQALNGRGAGLEEIYREKLEQKERWDIMTREKESLIKRMDEEMKAVTGEKNALLAVGEDIRYTLIDIFQEIAVLHNEIRSVEEEKSTLRNREADALREREAMGQYSLELQERLRQQGQLLEKEETDWKALDREIESMAQRKKELEEGRRELAQNREKALETYQTAASRLKALQEIQKDYHGYYGGVRSILKERDRGSLQGIFGVVGELIQVEPQLEKAVETALGGSMQDLVAESTDAARKAIEFLKSSNAGRGTFLPLDAIRPRRLSQDQEALLGLPGVLGIGAALVKAERQFQPVLDNLLGNVLFVSDMKRAAEIARQSGQRVKIVTLEGEVFMPGGAITGGHSIQKASVLSRIREIQELKEAASRERKVLDGLDAKLNELDQELYPLEGRIGARELRLKEQQEKLVQARRNLDLQQMELKNLEEKSSMLQEAHDTLGEELEGLSKEQELLRNSLAQKESQKEGLEKAKEGKEEDLRVLDARLEELGDELLAEKLALGALKEKVLAYEESLSSYYTEQADMKASLLRKGEILEENAGLIAQAREEALQIRQAILLGEEEYEGLEGAIHQDDAGRDALQAENLALENSLRGDRKILREQEESLHRLEIQKAKLETDRGNKVALLQEKFQLLPGEAMDRRVPVADKREEQRRLRSLQQGISALGTVNLGAIEEFARVRERLDFLKEQETDLEKSMEALGEVIRNIEEIMTERFTASYEQLNLAFGETYQALFGGGEAFMALTDPGDFLNSGIEIYSNPPGKTPKSLSALSGGERALTALALLFSLLKINPSPLCIIDEADASLDERNVANFANYLRNYSKNTQFIVISHRQGTIEESDNLYGVTMDKSGVSKIISVTLDHHRRMDHA